MDAKELLDLVSGGENSRVQLKENVTNATSVAQEIVAFANSKGGKLIIGVNDKTGDIVGLSFADLQRINNMLTTAANEHVKSAIVIDTETVDVDGKKVIVAHVPEGNDKPHTDKDGLIFIKNGSDKRKVTSKEELSRMLQSSGNLYAEQMLIRESSIKDLDWGLFREFYEKKYQEDIALEDFQAKVENLTLGAEGKINLAGNLLFGKNPQRLSPNCYIAAIWFQGNDLAGTKYLSSENIGGDMPRMFKDARKFVIGCLRKVQNGKDFNSLGDLEVPEIVINELLINALIHRDYFVHDSIKVFVFDNRIEIKSPGKLPNSLTTEQIKAGLSRRRNHILASYALDLLPYRGAGSGILRALQAWPAIEFHNFPETEQFNVIIHRPAHETQL
ncbi:RNA-binding domain-containing protein [Haliscomenobacter sp.]|uniref:RNA-binding domain-containing protein n=1 Tax=Haliscomenobacter sp. TaxID=2717303 RepID=UPI003364D978